MLITILTSHSLTWCSIVYRSLYKSPFTSAFESKHGSGKFNVLALKQQQNWISRENIDIIRKDEWWVLRRNVECNIADKLTVRTFSAPSCMQILAQRTHRSQKKLYHWNQTQWNVIFMQLLPLDINQIWQYIYLITELMYN